ncbi:hypothetical protein MYU51_018745 [Penicillium brevicompactum]
MTGPTRQKRKSRSRGLRATTGCLICKRRHVKCDEAQPQCGPCVKGNRPCVYVSRESSTGPHPEYGEAIHSPANVHAPLQVLVDACQQEQDLDRSNAVSSTASPSVAPTLGSPAYLPHSEPPHGSVLSPGTEVSVTPSRGAPLSWLPRTPEGGQTTNPQHSKNLRPRSWRERESFEAAAFPRVSGIEARHILTIEAEASLPDNPSSWTTSSPIPLSDLERHIFNHFIGHSSQWLDFYDPIKQFSTTVPHLALHNPGLMKALLAFTARHISLGPGREAPLQSRPSAQSLAVDRNAAVEYYYETLHYLNQAMQYPSYARSHEEERDTMDMPRRLERGSELLYMLQQWHEHLPHEFNALPTVAGAGVFAPIWVHPPNYAAALQAHSLARILVILHRPSSGSLQDQGAAQKLLTFSVNTICGIASAIDPEDTTSSLSTLPFIFGAGILWASGQQIQMKHMYDNFPRLGPSPGPRHLGRTTWENMNMELLSVFPYEKIIPPTVLSAPDLSLRDTGIILPLTMLPGGSQQVVADVTDVADGTEAQPSTSHRSTMPDDDFNWQITLARKVVAITGANRGIGLGIAEVCLSNSASMVYSLDLMQPGEEFASLQKKYPNLQFIQTDVTSEESVENAVDEVVKSTGRIDGLVANAALSPVLTPAQVFGAYFCAQTAARKFIELGIKGSIVMTFSMTSYRPNRAAPSAPYGATKAAVRNMCHTLAMEWSEHGIRVNSISPGFVRTAMTYYVEKAADWDLKMQYYGGMPRLADPRELGGAYVYLLSDASSYTTGIDIPIAGIVGAW